MDNKRKSSKRKKTKGRRSASDSRQQMIAARQGRPFPKQKKKKKQQKKNGPCGNARKGPNRGRTPLYLQKLKEWQDRCRKEITAAADRGGWTLDREYTSAQQSRYLWFRRDRDLVKIRLADHGIALAPPPGKPRPIATWSVSIERHREWQYQLSKATKQLRAAA